MIIAVFDDNEYALRTIEETVDAFFEGKNYDYDVFGFSDTADFHNYYINNKIDIAFLDIAVDGNSKFGLKCAEEIRHLNDSAHIIFTTVMGEYMPLSFEGMIRPTHYLVKPFSGEKIFEIMENIINDGQKKKITLKCGNTVCRLNINEILYIIQEKNKMTVYTRDSVISVYKSLKSIYEELEGRFIFADKNVLVNPDEIKQFDIKNNRLVMSDWRVIFVSVRRKSAVKKIMEGKV